MRNLERALVALAFAMSVSCAAAFASGALPQLTVNGTGPCCPNPRFLAPRSKDGYGRNAAFDAPAGIAYDPDDDAFFITDSGSNTIRRYDRDGMTSTVAGACDPELVMDTCVGRDLDGVGAIARFDRPSCIVYDRRLHALIVYDAGSSALRLVTVSGLVRTIGWADGITGLAINDRKGFLYAAQGRSIVWILIDEPSPLVVRIWTVPSSGDRDAPIYDVNALAFDDNTGDIFASVFSRTIYRLHLSTTWKGTLFVGNRGKSRTFGEAGADGRGTDATFHDAGALAFDDHRQVLYVVDFRTIRSISRNGTVTSVAGGCERQTDARYRGEFACDYPANDGIGMQAHFGWPIVGLAVDSRNGDLALLDQQTLKRMSPTGLVTTLAGNSRPQVQHGPSTWTGRYLDTATGDTLDVFVRGDREIEISNNAAGEVFDVRSGRRSTATGFAQFWNAPTYVRTGDADARLSLQGSLDALRCGAFTSYGSNNPMSKSALHPASAEHLFFDWYYTFGRGQVAEFLESARCTEVRARGHDGNILYEDDESRVVPHYVPDGLIEYPDQRALYN